jgi:MinD-like ATPase involved in chromosome partitioning or flagellar assembly
MVETISFISVKGGVGKTTLALETATCLANSYKKRVLLIDGNFSAPNLGLHLNLTNEITLHDALEGVPLHNVIYEAYGVDVIPADIYRTKHENIDNLKKLIEKFKPRYDFIIIDSAPNIRELEPILKTVDKVFLVTSPDHVTLETTLKSAKIAKSKNIEVHGVIINKIRKPKYEMTLEKIEKFSGIPVIAKIKEHKNMAKSAYFQKPFSLIEPKNPISKEIRNFCSAITGTPEPRSILKRLKVKIPKQEVNRDMLRQNFYNRQLI